MFFQIEIYQKFDFFYIKTTGFFVMENITFRNNRSHASFALHYQNRLK